LIIDWCLAFNLPEHIRRSEFQERKAAGKSARPANSGSNLQQPSPGAGRPYLCYVRHGESQNKLRQAGNQVKD
jgi:hypothetical protein